MQSKLHGNFGRSTAPYQSTVKRMIKKFEETGLFMDSKLPVRHRTGRSLDNIAAVSESVAESPGISPLFTTIGHSKKHHAVNSHERSAPTCVQDQLTQELKPTERAAPRFC